MRPDLAPSRWLRAGLLGLALVGLAMFGGPGSAVAQEAAAPAGQTLLPGSRFHFSIHVAPAPSAPMPLPSRVPVPKNIELPIKVGVSLYINGVGKVNEAGNTYFANVDLTERWHDPNLAFDVAKTGTDRLVYANEEAGARVAGMWNPQVTIDNLVAKESSITPGLFVFADGTVTYIQRIKGTFESKYALASFPFDTQTLPITLISSKYSANQLFLMQDESDIASSGMSDTMRVGGWKPLKLNFATSHVRALNGETVQQMETQLTIRRQPFNHMFAIYTPFLLILLVPSLTTFYVKNDLTPRVTAWGASILAMTALNFTFSVRYPFLDNFSLVGLILNTGFVCQAVGLILVLTIYNPAFADKRFSQYEILSITQIMRWAVPVTIFSILATEALLTAYTW